MKLRRERWCCRQFPGQPEEIRRKTALHRDGGGETKAGLYEEAKRRGIQGRSTMSKAELEQALAR